jgi:hypothetical protein
MNAALILACVFGGALLFLFARAALYRYPPPALTTVLLTRKEQAVIAAFADALFPAGGSIPLSGTEAGLLRYMDDYLLRTPPGSRTLIRLLLIFVEYGPWIFGPRRARFSCLSVSERDAALTDMARSSVYFRRIAFLSMRTMLSMGYLANDLVADRIGMRYDASPFESRRRSTAAELVAAPGEHEGTPKRPPSVPPPGVAA